MRGLLKVGLALAAVLVLVASVNAGPIRVDNFTATMTPDGVVTGEGTGWDNGRFVRYESGWYNQWFYNDPPRRDRWKWITYDITVAPVIPDPDRIIEIAINWSTMQWPENPTLPPVDVSLAEEDMYIVRYPIFTGTVVDTLTLDSQLLETEGVILLPFNPEWVSIDIRQVSPGNVAAAQLTITGVITHQCVPEPSTLALLALGGLALVLARKFR
ncbi:MAG: PEP-CTERM sorting domain-containing protein [Pirellulales bacterium]|nr:PEP-CTERM sorting domain-containing protein [Pirellulales bacterium]